ncbi:MAG: hypothetical protein JST48_09525 [Bacteroidetes bacterium]|nr:hypothetical protein [Bacteroidota bacterium]
MRILRGYFYLCVYLSGIQNLLAQSTSTQMGARAAGMGFASSTLTDESAMFNNMGGLAKIAQPSVSFAYETRPSLTGANRMAASIATPTKAGVFGVSIFKFGDDVYSEQLLSTGFSNTLGNTSLGIKANYVQYRAEGFGMSNTVSFDFGGITKITEQISIGAYITNLTQAKLTGLNATRLPTKLVAGVGFQPNEKTFITSEIEKDLEYAASWRSGIEYAVYKKILVRTGFSTNPNTAYVGIGVRKNKIKFDYAFSFNRYMGTAHQASAVYLLSSSGKK